VRQADAATAWGQFADLSIGEEEEEEEDAGRRMRRIRGLTAAGDIARGDGQEGEEDSARAAAARERWARLRHLILPPGVPTAEDALRRLASLHVEVDRPRRMMVPPAGFCGGEREVEVVEEGEESSRRPRGTRAGTRRSGDSAGEDGEGGSASAPPRKLLSGLRRNQTLPQLAMSMLADFVRGGELPPSPSHPPPTRTRSERDVGFLGGGEVGEEDRRAHVALLRGRSKGSSSNLGLATSTSVTSRRSGPSPCQAQALVSGARGQEDQEQSQQHPQQQQPSFVVEQQPLFIFQEPRFEHLDFLWATEVRDRAFPAVLALVDRYRHRQTLVEAARTARAAGSINAPTSADAVARPDSGPQRRVGGISSAPAGFLQR
jgi:hypothetical protein